MRVGLLLSLLVSCAGEPVVDTVDASTPADSSADSAPTETAAGECEPVAGNLLPDFNFSLGIGNWVPSECKTELVEGRCGRKALRVYDIKWSARVRRVYNEFLSKDKKVHLRAWFRRSSKGSPPDGAPTLFTRTYERTDAGERYYDDSLSGALSPEWRLSETIYTLRADQSEGWELMIDQFHPETDVPREFEIADLSLVQE